VEKVLVLCVVISRKGWPHGATRTAIACHRFAAQPWAALARIGIVMGNCMALPEVMCVPYARMLCSQRDSIHIFWRRTSMSQQDLDAAVQSLERLTTQEKLALLERLARSLQGDEPGISAVQQQAALQRLQQELAALPVMNPADGFSNRQHDQLLYGAP
jgi:hypothetical protein